MAQSDSHLRLNKILVTPWVLGTVNKMSRSGAADKLAWNDSWIQTYRELGGQSEESGNKPCPRAGVYGLWFFGRLRDGGRPILDFWTVDRTNQQLGRNKNAAYSIIAADLLIQGAAPSAKTLWPAIQAEYVKHTGHEPAVSEQGEIRMVVGLFCDQKIVSG
jgi:hypothetical protein